MTNTQITLEERDLRYRDVDFFHHPIIGKELVRLSWRNPKYKGHFKTVKGDKYFDDFIMDELKVRAEKNSGGLGYERV